MRRAEFHTHLKRHGIKKQEASNYPFPGLLDYSDGQGSGIPREYTEAEVRLCIAWKMVTDLCGIVYGGKGQLQKDLAQVLARWSFGFAVATGGLAYWVPRIHTRDFIHGAVVIPCPDWRELLDAS